MDEIKGITEKELKDIAAKTKFNELLLEKDYLLTELLFLLKDIKGIYFKGGTALNKIFLNHARLSEELDFTSTKKVSVIEKQIKLKLKDTKFNKITHDKRVDKFTRLIIHYKLFHENGTIFIDLNQKAKLNSKPEKHEIKHFYSEFIPSFSVNTLSEKEMIAEKMQAAISRNKPRDHFDLFQLIEKGIKIDLNLVKQKCIQSKTEFSILKMFHNANKLKNRWNTDLIPLLNEEVSFEKTMKTLAKYFNLKKEKKALK
ncbi:MAG: nucleotidyl transferase AbiEii/AbiGii toxin family protein [Candidatus Diapherotrites archaeon]|nr:nucleotidyl transferase AbiEii/AbiGii toxin family protein [Candidatus Diapherotrites archaeon]